MSVCLSVCPSRFISLELEHISKFWSHLPPLNELWWLWWFDFFDEGGLFEWYISIYLKGGCLRVCVCMCVCMCVCVCVYFFVRSRFSQRPYQLRRWAIAQKNRRCVHSEGSFFDFWFSRSFALKIGKTCFSRQFPL